MSALARAFRKSPEFRFALRTIVVAVISYFVAVLAQGGAVTDWTSFAWGIGGAIANALVGLLTPVEPFVGVKPKAVEVPRPPAVIEKNT